MPDRKSDTVSISRTLCERIRSNPFCQLATRVSYQPFLRRTTIDVHIQRNSFKWQVRYLQGVR